VTARLFEMFRSGRVPPVGPSWVCSQRRAEDVEKFRLFAPAKKARAASGVRWIMKAAHSHTAYPSGFCLQGGDFTPHGTVGEYLTDASFADEISSSNHNRAGSYSAWQAGRQPNGCSSSSPRPTRPTSWMHVRLRPVIEGIGTFEKGRRQGLGFRGRNSQLIKITER